ncbi:hypothetical protein [Limosilactobacillus kribbianus]|uniref:hypothetical protein n=1 Tax=Limosilactobacillus kribbianus TaxID=2982695 RepID=UPI0022641B03|nr:hypothetical protein [Limosilactobacillus kribbianus]
MNRELKHLFYLIAIFFIISIVIINVHTYLSSSKFIPDASRTSQVANANRLRRPNRNHSSESKASPDLHKQSHLRVIAVTKLQKIFVLSGHRVIYTMHARVNASSQSTSSQGHFGQQITHVGGRQVLCAGNWVALNHHLYFVAPTTIGQRAVAKNWLKQSFNFPRTIQVSQPDALWLRSLPKGTPVTIR